ncbi:MAG: 50S ribosomal protein L6 [Clostridiaceae bacterium]
MSRIGKLPVVIPNGVTVTLAAGNVVNVKGPKGQLERSFSNLINIEVKDNSVIVSRSSDEKQKRALHGLTRALIQNMVIGVNTGYSKTLELVGVGYRAQVKDGKLIMNLGYSHPVEIVPVEGIKFETPVANKIVVSGISKELVGAVAADVRTWRKPEPYKGKGIKYENEVILRKEGKTGK